MLLTMPTNPSTYLKQMSGKLNMSRGVIPSSSDGLQRVTATKTGVVIRLIIKKENMARA